MSGVPRANAMRGPSRASAFLRRRTTIHDDELRPRLQRPMLRRSLTCPACGLESTWYYHERDFCVGFEARTASENARLANTMSDRALCPCDPELNVNAVRLGGAACVFLKSYPSDSPHSEKHTPVRAL